MPPNEEVLFKINVKCCHCGKINEIPYSDFRSAMIGNHFFKLLCDAQECRKRTFVTYSFFTMPYNYGEIPEKVFQRLTIPEDTCTNNLKPSDIKLD